MPQAKPGTFGIRAAARKKKAREFRLALFLGLLMSLALAGLFWFINWHAHP